MRVQLGSADVAGFCDVARSHGGSDAATDAECGRRPSEKAGSVVPACAAASPTRHFTSGDAMTCDRVSESSKGHRTRAICKHE